ncbi:MAG: spore cortex biosynthesis protein YabQ [Firmicutes bacterium]|nr:spore cortex biosynthesis protein YabQ [Bacillota bacterium]
MIVSFSGQAFIFILAVVLGFALGFLYDIIRISRIALPCPFLLRIFTDGLYWMAAIYLSFSFMESEANGDIRFFILLGLFLGMIIYYNTLSILILKLSRMIISAVRKFFHALFAPVIKFMRKASLRIGARRKFYSLKAKKVLHFSGKYAKMNLERIKSDLCIIKRKK